MQQRKLWSKNANAAKARKRLSKERNEVIPKHSCPTFFPWKITVEHLLTKEKATLKPRSKSHCYKALQVTFDNYV
jgi:hypothetical protein